MGHRNLSVTLGAILATIVVGLPTTASAATRPCSIRNDQEGLPGITQLRATRTTCRTARGVGAALRRAARLGELERRPIVDGRRFACTFKRRNSSEGAYFATVCQNRLATVSMRYYATGLAE